MSQPDTEKLIEILLGAALSRAVCSIAELGVADHIQKGSPQSVASLARATATHERSLYRVMRFLASHGLFQETGNQEFDHTSLSLCLRSDAENSFRAAAQMIHRTFGAWDGLHHSLLTGEAGFKKAYGLPIFEYIPRHPDLGPIFDAGMTSIHGYETAAMLDAYDFSDVHVLADIGGGNGSLITGVFKRYSGMKGILFDLGHVIGRAKQNLQASGLSERCAVIEGSFFETIPSGADAYLFRHIIHDWTDEQCLQILGHCRKVIPNDGKLLIVETIVPTDNKFSIAKDFDITMMTYPGGLERTEEEYGELLQKAGFRLTSITPTRSMVSVIESKPL